MKTIRNERPEGISRRVEGAGAFFQGIMICGLAFFFVSCQSMDPRNVDIEIPETAPAVKITSFTEALPKLGLMTQIYSTDQMNIQSNDIGDRTGASASTGSEIPRDITEMLKTTLNSIGGNVIYIPYDPAFIQNQQVTGYSTFENKLIPDIVLSGGITEFDRGLATRGENTDVDLEAEIKSIPDFLPSKNIGVRAADEAKAGLARITLDFNLLDFRTLAGIPKMNAVNTMEVLKGVAAKELGVSLAGQNFGLKGTIKKVQGRHAAVRLLVELSMIQIVGKYTVIPYWRLLGEDALPDPVVTDTLARAYASMNQAEATSMVQQWLFIYGHDVPLTGELEEKTKKALAVVDPDFDPSSNKISSDTFVKVYVNIPITYEAGNRQVELASLLQAQQPEEAVASTDVVPATEPAPALAGTGQPTSEQEGGSAVEVSSPVEATPAPQPEAQPTLVQQSLPQESVPVPAPVAAAAPPAQAVENAPRQPRKVEQEVVQKPVYVAGPKRSGIGKFLSEEEW